MAGFFKKCTCLLLTSSPQQLGPSEPEGRLETRWEKDRWARTLRRLVLNGLGIPTLPTSGRDKTQAGDMEHMGEHMSSRCSPSMSVIPWGCQPACLLLFPLHLFLPLGLGTCSSFCMDHPFFGFSNDKHLSL